MKYPQIDVDKNGDPIYDNLGLIDNVNDSVCPIIYEDYLSCACALFVGGVLEYCIIIFGG